MSLTQQILEGNYHNRDTRRDQICVTCLEDFLEAVLEVAQQVEERTPACSFRALREGLSYLHSGLQSDFSNLGTNRHI